MAKVVRQPLIIFDATDQAEGLGQGGVLDVPLYVKYVAFETDAVSAAGTFDLRFSNDGDNIVPQYTVADSSAAPVEFAVEGMCNAVYAEEIPTGGRIFVYVGRI